METHPTLERTAEAGRLMLEERPFDPVEFVTVAEVYRVEGGYAVRLAKGYPDAKIEGELVGYVASRYRSVEEIRSGEV